MSIKALAAEVRGSASAADQRLRIEGELVLPGGVTSAVTVRDIANKIVHGSPDRVEVSDGDIRVYFVNSLLDVDFRDLRKVTANVHDSAIYQRLSASEEGRQDGIAGVFDWRPK